MSYQPQHQAQLPSGMRPQIRRRLRRTSQLISALLMLGIFAGIYYLTEQSPDQTTELTYYAQALIDSLFGKFSKLIAALAVWRAQLGLGDADISFALMRKLAHTAEFGAFALAALWFWASWIPVKHPAQGRRTPRRWSIACAALITSIAASLFDQTHKLYVVGRHFDWTDLPFDALGYLGVLIIYLIISLIRQALQQRSGS